MPRPGQARTRDGIHESDLGRGAGDFVGAATAPTTATATAAAPASTRSGNQLNAVWRTDGHSTIVRITDSGYDLYDIAGIPPDIAVPTLTPEQLADTRR